MSVFAYFFATLVDSNKFIEFGRADDWFTEKLNKSEVGQLINELKELHEQMEE